MQLSFNFNRGVSLTALIFFLLSILNIAIGAPLSQNGVSEKSLTARAVKGSTITVNEYMAYLQQYYPKTDQYIEYSGYSEPQVKAFQAKNPGYYYYDDFFNAANPNSHWDEAFGADKREDDAEASGEAISKVATDKITVFGAAQWETAGAASFYATTEAKINLVRLASGDLKSINHMAKDATDLSEIMATEDAKGLHYNAGYTEGTANNSEAYCDTPECDSPETNSERSSSASNSVYGDPAAQETPIGDPADPHDPATTDPKPTTTTTTDPAVVEDPGDIHI
ncbi:hypothetical protein OCU04_001026 [Sclerotinia nivalis]|uniref:Uncharacterized protein n=1 Tax=Sclerotinia nivalis TaxID=352851 RepID=A0A9X0AXA4_9HELO|nr:hypothetical protein OCU04_001026 [Sclerotinia nivalis]